MAQPLTQILTHASDALAQLARQYQAGGGAQIVAMATGEGTRAQTIETALWQIYTETGISPNASGFTVSTGAQLDLLGRLVGQPRGTLTDVDYTALLRATIRRLLSSGTIPDLIAIFSLMLPTTVLGSIVITESFPAAIILDLTGVTGSAFNPQAFDKVLQIAKAAGVRALLHYTYHTLPATFSFATVTNNPANAGDVNSGPGGFFDASSPNQDLYQTTDGAGAWSGILD